MKLKDYELLYDLPAGEYEGRGVDGVRTVTYRAGRSLEVMCHPITRIGAEAKREAKRRRKVPLGAVQDGGEYVIETMKNIALMVCRYIMAAWLGWYVLSELMQHGEVEKRKHDAVAAFFGCFFTVMLLAGGGFWG